MTTEQLEVVKALEEKLEAKGFANQTDVDAIKASIELLKDTTELEAVKTLAQTLETEIAALKEVAKPAETSKGLAGFLTESMEVIKNLAKKTGATIELVIKADTLRASIEDNAQATDLTTIGQLATRKLSLYNLFPKIPVSIGNHNGVIRYYDWDEATTDRAAAMVAEGQPFPQSEAKWKMYSLDLKKIGDTLPVSAEFYEDAAMFAAELNLFITTNVELIADDQIANGDGQGQNLTGLLESVPAFDSNVVSQVVNATFYDLLAVATEQISIPGGAKYQPNFVVMRKSMINRLRLTKDANDNYIIPPFVSRDGVSVDGMTIIESNVIPDNQLVLGDSAFARIYEIGGIQLSRGTIGDQFAEDMETLKVRKRLAFLIRTVDQTGFIKIEDVTAAIAAITAS